ncbi:MAG: ATP-binding protein [Rickettsiales bacterium]|nr:ATP-binding protein [Rickettsiales bacterium]
MSKAKSFEDKKNHKASDAYLSAMEKLITVVQELSKARDINAITAIVREAARNLTGADGASFVLRDGDQCYYADESAIAPLWKGKRFPMSACISGWVMLNRQPAIIEDIYSDPRIPAVAYRPTFVKSLAMVPIRRNAPIGAIGNYWATRRLPTQEEVAILQALADTTSVALENAELYTQLQQQVKTLQSQQTRIQEQCETLEVFTRALAHDLKEPVRTMMSFSQIVGEEQEPPEKRQTYFRYIQDAANRMGMLVDTVFQYTQLDDPSKITKDACDMQYILKGTKDNLAQLIQERGANVSAVGDLPVIQANPAHMIQVIQNLVANAVRHNEDRVNIKIQAREQSDHWLFSVRDNGSGIKSEQLEKIFLPFKRLTHKEECAGLGLSTCRKIVALYGGKIWCESTPGEGATFFFTLPKAPTAQTPKSTLANILLVDDRKADLELTKIALLDKAEIECNVLTARDGEEAHNILCHAKSTEDRIDLIVLDINMPGMDGFELLKHVRKDEGLKDTAVIICSGSNHEMDKKLATSLGVIGCLVKPPSFDTLETILEQTSLRLFQEEEGKGRKLLRAA